MTREEAIAILEVSKHMATSGRMYNQAIDMAIEALSAPSGDLISRADAINFVTKLIWNDGEIWNDVQDKIVDGINALPSAEARWIPCSERLPEDGTTVITFDSTGDIEFGSYENGKWYWLAEACADYWTRNSGVLAWMPLPKPYRGEQIDNNT